jgi:hypothetical protein
MHCARYLYGVSSSMPGPCETIGNGEAHEWFPQLPLLYYVSNLWIQSSCCMVTQYSNPLSWTSLVDGNNYERMCGNPTVFQCSVVTPGLSRYCNKLYSHHNTPSLGWSSGPFG